jgi:8-oxo-dGTP pyrophosphatase MutT (NUDIX family)
MNGEFMAAGDWTLVGSQSVLRTPWIAVRRNAYRLPSGTVVDDYYVVSRAPFVLVAALTADRGIVLVRQFRPATGRTYLALPAGYVEPGEDVVAAALRELKEETGYTGRRARRVAELHPLPGYVNSPAYVVLCDAEPAGPLSDTDEIREVTTVPLAEAVSMVKSGHIDEMQAVAAILLVALEVPDD